MCAIYGLISDKEFNIKKLEKKIDQIEYRGPDGKNFFFLHKYKKNIYLSHRRLKIIDFSIANSQPFISSDLNYILVFNGEIYNFHAIKKILQKKYKFITDGDTEVLLYSFIEWGFKCLDFLDGMFSFLILSKKEGKIFFARDRFGKKPLYYTNTNNTFEFCSEIGPLINNQSILLEGVNQYFAYGYVPREQTVYRNIKKLLPAHYGLYDIKNNNLVIKKYWDFPKNQINDRLTKLDIEENIWNLLKQAVHKRIYNSDASVGIFLSGGLDSSLIVAAAHENNFKNVLTFSLNFKNDKNTEKKFSKEISSFFKTSHHEIEIEDICFEEVNSILEKIKEPIADPSLIPFYLISKYSSRFIKVALTGDGGDEVFAGYDYYKRLMILNKFKDIYPNFLNNFLKSISNIFPAGIIGKNFFNSFSYGISNVTMINSSFFDHNLRAQLFSKDVLTLLGQNLFQPELERLTTNNSNQNILENILRLDFKNNLSECFLTKVDRASMMNSLEIRNPYLDLELVEYCFKFLVPSLKANSFNTRIIQKIIAKKKLPTNFFLNRKKGFVLPIEKIVGDSMIDFIKTKLVTSNIFNKNFVLNILDNKKRNLLRIYSLYCYFKSF
jgi:asparagine synthase (glutamine-hydrolysing)